MNIKLDQCSPELRARILADMAALDRKPLPPSRRVLPGKRLRQSTKPLLNKLELEFLGVLRALPGLLHLRAQAKRFKLANGIWYKPDFTGHLDGQEVAYEVKGPRAWRGGFENLKVAASQFPEIKWVLVWKVDGAWESQIVIP